MAGSGVDGPAGEAVVLCREPEPLVAAVVDTSGRLLTSAEKSAMVGKSQRCSSKIKLRRREYPGKALHLGLLPPTHQGNHSDKVTNNGSSDTTVQMGERGGGVTDVR